MTTRDPIEIEETLIRASEELKNLETIDDVKKWWSTYYVSLGHRRLGRLLLGQPVERLVERSLRGTSE